MEAVPQRRTSVGESRVRKKKDENAAVILWEVKATNLSKKGELIRVKFLFSSMRH